MNEVDKLKTKIVIYQNKVTALEETNIDLSIELQAARDELKKLEGDTE